MDSHGHIDRHSHDAHRYGNPVDRYTDGYQYAHSNIHSHSHPDRNFNCHFLLALYNYIHAYLYSVCNFYAIFHQFSNDHVYTIVHIRTAEYANPIYYPIPISDSDYTRPLT